MIHFFDIDIAKRYGVLSAVLLQNLQHWIEKNKANGKNFFDGHYWTYNSRKAFTELFPYATARQVDTALKKLIDDGVIITGNYNTSAYDRTLWYAITEKGISILQKCKMENTKNANGKDENVTPIPNINTIINTNINTNMGQSPPKRFTAPVLEEVKAYCVERKNNVDAERFIDYYTANGWKVGKNPMKDWKAAVRSWERNDFGKPKTAETEHSFDLDDFFNSAVDKARRQI